MNTLTIKTVCMMFCLSVLSHGMPAGREVGEKDVENALRELDGAIAGRDTYIKKKGTASSTRHGSM